MPINADKPHLWKADVARSVDLFNTWFMECAPAAYRNTRVKTTEAVKQAMEWTTGLTHLDAATLMQHPKALPMLRMCTAPPIARDRLIGLAEVPKSFVQSIEKGKLPTRMNQADLTRHLTAACAVISRLLDEDVLPWIAKGTEPSDGELQRAATIVADRLCGAVSDPIIRNAQEQRQLCLIEDFLLKRGYRKQAHPAGSLLTDMVPGTFTLGAGVLVRPQRPARIGIDVMIFPKTRRRRQYPIMMDVKSFGSFTIAKRGREEDATKIQLLRETYGKSIQLILFLAGYIDASYLGYTATEGLDWVWEHRIDDLLKLGV